MESRQRSEEKLSMIIDDRRRGSISEMAKYAMVGLSAGVLVSALAVYYENPESVSTNCNDSLINKLQCMIFMPPVILSAGLAVISTAIAATAMYTPAPLLFSAAGGVYGFFKKSSSDNQVVVASLEHQSGLKNS